MTSTAARRGRLLARPAGKFGEASRVGPTADLEVAEFESANQITAHAWGEVAPANDPLWTRAFFLAMEKAGVGADRMRYLALSNDGALTAIAPVFWFYALDVGRTIGPPWSDRISSIRRFVPGLLREPALFCGHPLGERAFIAAPGEEQSVWATVTATVERIARREGLKLLAMKDLLDADVITMAASPRTGRFSSIASFPDAVLSLPGKTYDDYLNQLSTKARRNVRSKRRKVAATPEIELRVDQDYAGSIAAMVPLYEQVYQHAEVALDHLEEGFFRAVEASPEIDSEVIGCWLDSHMVGFVLCIYAHGRSVALRIGLDYAVARQYRLWFALNDEVIRRAIERRCSTVNFGQTTYNAKREIGCDLVELFNATSHVDRFQRVATSLVLPVLQDAYRERCGL